MKFIGFICLTLLIVACTSTPKASLQEYQASVECTALLNLAMGLQQKDRNIPDAELASSRNAWIRKAASYDGFNQSSFKTSVTQLGNKVLSKFGGQVTKKQLNPLSNRCLLR